MILQLTIWEQAAQIAGEATHSNLLPRTKAALDLGTSSAGAAN